jgi:hypothetical protein
MFDQRFPLSRHNRPAPHSGVGCGNLEFPAATGRRRTAVSVAATKKS